MSSMRPERWRRVEQLFYAALDRDESQRATFLAAACQGDEGLRREVESLLARQKQAENFMETPAAEVAAKALAHEQIRSGPSGDVGPRFPRDSSLITGFWKDSVAAAWAWCTRPKTPSLAAALP